MSSVPAIRQSVNTPAPRHERIGSGDIASILGLPDAFGSPYSVWVAKTTGVEPEPDDKTRARFWWGDKLEPAILERYEILFPGNEPVRGGRQKHFVHPDYPFLTATADDIFETCEFSAGDGEPKWAQKIVEAKTSHLDLGDGLPLRVQAQLQWQMGISGIHLGTAVVLFVSDTGRDIQVWDLPFDEATFETIKNRAIQFWFDHVVPEVAPEIDGHRATTASLKRIEGIDRFADISHVAGIVEQLGQTKASRKSLEKTEAELTNKIKFELDSASVGQINGKDAVTWRTSKSGSRTFLIKKAFQPKGLDDE